jgi:serine/threonine protein phosphatase PrpC
MLWTGPWVRGGLVHRIDRAHAVDWSMGARRGAEQPDEDSKTAGSTATVALLRRDKIIVANVGDSRAVLSRGGQAVDMSTEHRCTIG